jgi:hypothetical protein
LVGRRERGSRLTNSWIHDSENLKGLEVETPEAEEPKGQRAEEMKN